MSESYEFWNNESITKPVEKEKNVDQPRNLSPESLKSPDVKTYRDAIKEIKFWITSVLKNEKLVSQLSQNAEWNNSIEWLLAQNEQIQLLLSEMLSDYNNYIWTDKEQLKTMIQQEKLQIPDGQTQIMESMYEYMLQNDSIQWFENYLIHNGINIINLYLSTNLTKEWESTFISKNEIKIRLKTGRIQELYKWYREKHTEDSEALNKLEQELGQLNTITTFVKGSVDKEVKKYLGWKCSKTELANNLEWLLEKVNDNEMLKNFIGNKSQSSIDWLLRNSIKEYARLLNISDNNPQLLDSEKWDKIFNIQLRSYLYLYWIISHSEKFNSDVWVNLTKFDPKKWLDDNELWDILRSILMADWVMKSNWKNKYLASEQKLRKDQMDMDRTRRQTSREKINSIRNKKSKIEWQSLTQEKPQSLDIQNATWVEIAQDRDLWSRISENFNRKKSLDAPVNPLLQRNVLMKSWGDLAKENQGILSRYLNLKEVRQFFILQNNVLSFKNDVWERYKTKWITEHPEGNDGELDTIKNILLRLPSKYEENLKKAWENIDKKKDNAHETVKNYAIGAVIDNIKDMLQNIVNTNNTWFILDGFKFDENNSAKIENDCLLLSGKFNWETMNIKYDLKTWKLYMNSFINETSGMITITWSSEPKFELWELESFDNILDQFYASPTESMNTNIVSWVRSQSLPRKNENTPWWNTQNEQSTRPQPMHRLSMMRDKIREEHKLKFQKMCWTRLDEICWKIKDKVESKSIREPVALNLLRTLWIMPEDDNTKNIREWTDLYRIIKLITTPNNDIVDINKFSEYMKTFMDNICLSRWVNKNPQEQEKGDVAEIIFNENNEQSNISYVRDNAKNFDNEYSAANKKGQFDEKSNFWILKIVEEKFTDNKDRYPNRKLSASNIERFKNELEGEILEVKGLANLENKLNKAYNDNGLT